ncbi:MAG: UDP-N-acetylmuramate:L-alanyl-gamma-D-glutamyl-meso-diaminopimelate ligase [Acidobacteria bacterium]|nr:UDP-N-acetylmuramate:L-alanyl-gamma-D-glutamyl-meso-diaminopimelate ligase [Acidobacteriota bacterium]
MSTPHYHLIGICGTAMASLAGMLKAKGFCVTGSDVNVYPPMSILLEQLKIPVSQGFNPNNLDPAPDYVVIGNAIPRGNVEVEYTLNNKLRYVSMAEVLKEQFIRNRHSVVVAGTHGKTTTTSLMAWVMDVGGLNPSFLIGGIAENFGVSFRVTDSNYFVIEGDEYDTAYFDKGPKFMHYLPTTAIVNNIEYDHVDIYFDFNLYKLAFRRFINLIPSNGHLIAGVDSEVVQELIPRAFCPVESFAIDAPARWQAKDINYLDGKTHFTIFYDGKEYGKFNTSLVGNFNIRNSLAVIATAEKLGIEKEKIKEAIASFRSVKRRMEVRGVIAGITVIDDFAHHPTAVKETLLGAYERYKGQRLIAIFEPRSLSARRKQFQAAYEEAFLVADIAIIAALFEPHRVEPENQLSPTEIANKMIEQGKQGWSIPTANEIVSHLETIVKEGDVIMVMSNGGFDSIHEKLLSMLKNRFSK